MFLKSGDADCGLAPPVLVSPRIDADPAGESATYVFDASDGPGEYHLYFMPFNTCEFSGGGCGFMVKRCA